MSKNIKALFAMSIGALGVVYGDIGTSPLYAVNEIFFGHAREAISTIDVVGVISLIFWAITLTICIKYVFFVLRADSQGEGGVFALFSLLSKSKKQTSFIKFLLILLIIGSGLVLGDGIITPAISVVSAVEGIKVVTTSLSAYVVPFTIVILTGLFLIQKKGTHKVGKLFGPIIIVWFISIGSIGLFHLISNPEILSAVNPYQAFRFLSTHDLKTLLTVLGYVMLVITGGEAMYADMGHFGSKPIRFSWFIIVYPALILNYLGQGAFMLSGNEVIANNIFYSMVPKIALIPMVIIATFATIIASQALISGAFSIVAQAISLKLLPYFKVIHTHAEHDGQIYIPVVNWMLYVGCVILVITFQTSSKLASAYGLAVAGDMLITSLCMIAVSHYLWNWKLVKSLLIFLPFAFIDSSFLIANSLKLLEGGFIPLGIAALILVVIKSWQWGREFVNSQYDSYKRGKVIDLIALKKDPKYPIIPKAYVFMCRNFVSAEDPIPTIIQIFIDKYGALPQHIIMLNVKIEKVPYVSEPERCEIINYGKEGQEYDTLASVIVRFGFMEDPDVEKVLKTLAEHKKIQIDTNKHKWIIEVMHERLFPNGIRGIRRLYATIFASLAQVTHHSDYYFHIGDDEPMTVELFPMRLH